MPDTGVVTKKPWLMLDCGGDGIEGARIYMTGLMGSASRFTT